ncbi:hypothetical protein C7974DRAFT_424362 [Boeremia exigua]|uniref:uncharacterized protein n=1 Tax=Boeremia exigua TaxID=749465 RepID=UPI001E8E6A21|nr:uncharacterized protein C7974DRAFT_424362 [Boeremia exigua]KAH6629295.1 hypothetical protein C7974DRAFT_424362 [Boeremia exigua]
MPFKNPRANPSPYPPLPFYALRSTQLLASLVVAIIAAYFLHELAASNYTLPWTFILLLSVSLLTLLALAATLALHTRHTLAPALNLAANAALSALWCVATALLGWWGAPALGARCGEGAWGGATGARVCWAYKVLCAFAVVAVVGALGGVWLDVRALRRGAGRGRFGRLAGVEGEGEGEFGGVRPGARRGEGYELPAEQFGHVDTGYGGRGSVERL